MKLEKVFDECFINPIQSAVQEVINKHVIEIVETAFEAFAKYGYTKEWILHPDNQDRISITSIENRFYTYAVDRVNLFNITIRYMVDDINPFKFGLGIDVTYIAPLPKEVPNEK